MACDSLKAPATDANNLKSPSTPGVAPSPITSDVGTEFADTEDPVQETEVEPAPVNVGTTSKAADDPRSYDSPLDRMRSPRLTVHIPSIYLRILC